VLAGGIAIGSGLGGSDGGTSGGAEALDAASDDLSSDDVEDSGSQLDEVDEVAPDPTTTTAAPTTTTTDPESAAKRALDDRVVADRGRADAQLIDAWVPQVGSKYLGVYDQVTGITYDTYRSILDDFERQQARLGDVVLLSSSQFSTFREPGLYVVVAAEAFGSPDGANAWCDGQGLGPNDCFAKYLSHTVPAGPDAQEYRG
jgi:hypothetical protein